ncbi:MAG: transcription antitermination factor NusB [Hyphomicrobiaceae bacterium]|nr:transcription antitermination factor NusB [Hyphomicrobiaceae bacterium]
MKSPAGGQQLPLAPRTAARIAAIQALYQMDIAGTDLNDVLVEFATLRFGSAADDPVLADADRDFFRSLVQGVMRRQREIDPLIDGQLAEGWRLTRIDSILRAILRAGTLELVERKDVPVRVVITEYVNAAHAFLGDEEPRVVNGVLDKLARKLRKDEIS